MGYFFHMDFFFRVNGRLMEFSMPSSPVLSNHKLGCENPVLWPCTRSSTDGKTICRCLNDLAYPAIVIDSTLHTPLQFIVLHPYMTDDKE